MRRRRAHAHSLHRIFCAAIVCAVLCASPAAADAELHHAHAARAMSPRSLFARQSGLCGIPDLTYCPGAPRTADSCMPVGAVCCSGRWCPATTACSADGLGCLGCNTTCGAGDPTVACTDPNRLLQLRKVRRVVRRRWSPAPGQRRHGKGILRRREMPRQMLQRNNPRRHRRVRRRRVR
ncbi:hypothetical protein M427DRAFT_441189 [Gonapodya prolifera JEL478]|uniref:WAP domain-containing protein n=1 Tax=Gonapodya prolifera (strain JEL478) TaxID=1344416 RepID=A0A139A3E4_GONPJ|nr:hypothetical protein M427DRAFT_441189 [Gonapodya prolifera JEL478]|eukprot:KXS11290.1 hypothetical protein M427DRAFT_441189 [Gonapodya prolifera JEL478]